ncbi:MAG: hypothetical protein QNI99_17325 [Woeseiaceae bacterium]|nr:hypothetical protein [Woeseiaceae bacterium]
MRISKFFTGLILIVLGFKALLGGIAGLPEGIELANQGNFAGVGRLTMGLLIGPLLLLIGFALWWSGLKKFREKHMPEVSLADQTRDTGDGAEDSR